MQTDWWTAYDGGPMQGMRGMTASACGVGMMMGPSWSMSAPATAASLPETDSRGARLVGTSCVQCHALPSPSLHTKEEWAGVTQRMRGPIGDRAAAGVGVLVPSASDLDALTEYLSNHATDPSPQ